MRLTKEEAIAEIMRASRRFKVGDRVSYPHRGWVGNVTNEPSDNGIVYCRFDNVGQYGADPRKLEKVKRPFLGLWR
jgi:hypothetical protein